MNAIEDSKFVIDFSKSFPHLNSLSDIIVPADLNTNNDEKMQSVKVDLSTEDGSKLQSMMQDMYKEIGAVNLRNTGLTKAEEMKAVAQLIIRKSELYEGGANPRDMVPESSVYETGAPLTGNILLSLFPFSYEFSLDTLCFIYQLICTFITKWHMCKTR